MKSVKKILIGITIAVVAASITGAFAFSMVTDSRVSVLEERTTAMGDSALVIEEKHYKKYQAFTIQLNRLDDKIEKILTILINK